ncbi:hypothetical protein [Longimicrobium sp.]|uniref:hypothetical protein n=1 Tax=Longimicrobium sp. TaxID=2029185 RepID=UPI002C4B53B7|nr:hypothetical protein [Longimicrobium sp.]HSU13353.1 hypothetical protein [Longimicrobium sp.]
MKRRSLVLACAALGGCMLPQQPGRDDVFVSEGVADGGSFRCSEHLVWQMGYHVVSNTGESLQAERRLRDSDTETVRGYLSVSVAGDTTEPRLYVRAERVAETTRGPIPQPASYPPVTRPGFPPARTPGLRRREPRRVSPGEVAAHARSVVRACAVSGEIRRAE